MFSLIRTFARKIKPKIMNYLDRNEFNFDPSPKVLDAVKNFNPKDLCF